MDAQVDIAGMFLRLEGEAFRRHYTNAFGSLEDRLRGRDDPVAMAREAGVPGA